MFETATDIFASAVIFTLGFGAMTLVARLTGLSQARVNIIYLWHTLFAFGYAYLILNSGGDALYYYQSSLEGNVEWGTGTAGVIAITWFFSTGLGLSFVATSLIYQTFGAMGLAFFDAALKATTANKSQTMKTLSNWIVFLPSASFWTSGLGKDSLAFFGIGLVLWGMQNMRRRVFAIILGVAAVFLVRAHIGLLLLGAIGLASFFAANRGFLAKAAVLVMAAVAIYFAAPVVAERLNISNLASISELDEYIESRQGYNLDGGSSTDIASLSVPMRMFTYLYRPLFVDANNSFTLAASAENALILALSLLAIFTSLRNRGTSLNSLLFLFVYVVVCWFLLANTTANLGIAARQKWMIMPALFLLVFAIQQNIITRSRNPRPQAYAQQFPNPGFR